jgi:hypothetical protein
MQSETQANYEMYGIWGWAIRLNASPSFDKQMAGDAASGTIPTLGSPLGLNTENPFASFDKHRRF